MIRDSVRKLIGASILALFCSSSFAQNSLLVNFGTNSCTSSAQPSFSLIKNPLSAAPSLLTECTMAAQLPDIFAVFIAYNPKNNKIYIADIRNGIETKIWALDMGLPSNISCPAIINTAPDYSYSYISNNFEFDNNGDLWSFSNYDPVTGKCSMDKFDVNTGQVLNTRVLNFPAGNFPTSITSGDLTILPNGRMFATLGSFPSHLYEITDYSSTTGDATATYLTTLPQNCFGIAYLNGELEITGTDFSGGCYYYEYDIVSNVLKPAVSFQNGQLPIDNTSITPSLGATQQLLSAVKVNNNTADLTYEIFVKSLGNVSLNNINITEDLAAVYGGANISNVTSTFAPGGNVPGLSLNPGYNATSNTKLLLPGQNLHNQIAANTDYFFKLNVSLRVTNIDPARIYESSAIASGTIGSAGTLSFIDVADSSNNGPQTVVDPNNNGNAGEPGENNPTPFIFSTLPVKFISVSASSYGSTDALIKWGVATPPVNSDKFEVEFSTDASNWITIGEMRISNTNQGQYQFVHKNIPAGNLYYRIKETDIDGAYVYSKIVSLKSTAAPTNVVMYPNPAKEFITIISPSNSPGKTKAVLYDAVGRQILSHSFLGAIETISTGSLPAGAYILKVENNGSVVSEKVLIIHK